ncbi:hypothetical protein COW06_03050, partial [Candidatus Gracilibacteria bacterium CG12_big_fil_rev_8_21_14_0_65_38_15]
MEPKKKLFPKLKKKLRGFLTDESGKISKKDALGLSVGAMLLMGAEEVIAAHVNGCTSSVLANPVYANSPDDITNDAGASERNATCNTKGTITATATPSISHASGIVNGHYSSTITATANLSGSAGSGHSSHGSHG